MSQKGTPESQLSPAYVEPTQQQQKAAQLDPTSEPRTRSNSGRQERIRRRRRTANRGTINHSDSTTTSRFMASRSSNSRGRRTRTSDEGPRRKRGFSKRLNPSAWVRAVHKFNSVIVTT